MDSSVATVNKKTGVITAVSAGTTTVYVYAQFAGINYDERDNFG